MWRVASVAAMAVLTLVGGLDTRLSGRGAGDPQTVPCSTQGFKEAERAAYRALVKAQEEAARVLEDAITALQQTYNARLASEDQGYRAALLNNRGNANTTQALADNHAAQVAHLLKERDRELRDLRDAEVKAKEQAKRKYDEAVESARLSYCGEEPSDAAGAKQRAAERQRVQQAVTRVSTYAATIR